MTVRINCFDIELTFETEDDACWFDLDYEESAAEGSTLVINADREVYAVFTDEYGAKHYGTIGDDENDTLADNYPIDEETTYTFYENSETGKYYV